MLTAVVLVLLGLALFPLTLYVLVTRPQVFLILVVPSQVLLGGAERGSIVTGLRAGEVALAVCLGALVISRLWNWERIQNRLAARAVTVYALTASLLPLLAWRLSGHTVTLDALQAYAPVFKAVVIFLAVTPLSLEDREVKLVLMAGFWSVVISAVVAILQVLHFGWVESLLLAYFKGPHLYERLDGLTNRATGLAGNWHSLGLQFVMALIIGIMLFRAANGVARGLIVVGLALLALGLASVATVTSLVVLSGVAVVAMWQRVKAKNGRLGWFVAGAGGILSVLALIGMGIAKSRNLYFESLIPPGLYLRLYNWAFVYAPIIREHWVVGYGPFSPPVLTKSEDSQFVLLLLRAGTIGLVGWLTTLLLIGRWSRHVQTSESGQRIVRNCTTTFTWILLAASAMQAFFTYTGVVEMYWMFACLLGSFDRSSTSVIPIHSG